MVEYQTAKDNVDRILGVAPLEKELEKKKEFHAGQSALAWDFFVIKQPFCLKMLLFVRWYDKLFLDATIDGRRLPPLEISEFISIFLW